VLIAALELKESSVDAGDESTDNAETTLSGSTLQILATATGNARLPIVENLRV